MILDHKEGLKLTEEQSEQHFEVRMALARLAEGLFSLYGQVGEVENQIRDEARIANVTAVIAGGILENKPTGWLSCAFQWYAVSACNYAQLLGWLVTQNRDSAREYVNRVMPRVANYRNKIAAHFALTDPRRDNEADLVASVMTNIIFIHGRLCAAALVPVVKKGVQEIIASRDLSWSLTLAHERLVPRYWPNGVPRSYQSIKIPPGETTLNISWSDLTGDGT